MHTTSFKKYVFAAVTSSTNVKHLFKACQYLVSVKKGRMYLENLKKLEEGDGISVSC